MNGCVRLLLNCAVSQELTDSSQIHCCGTGGLQRNPKCLRSPCHPADVTHSLPEAFWAEYVCYKRRNAAVEVWSKTLFPAGLVEAASLVSRGRLPVLARQLSGHQDCKSTLLRLWQKHLLNSLLHCTLSFFACVNQHYSAALLRLSVISVVHDPFVSKVLRVWVGESHSWVCQTLFQIFSDLIREIRSICCDQRERERGRDCIRAYLSVSWSLILFNIGKEIADTVAYILDQTYSNTRSRYFHNNVRWTCVATRCTEAHLFNFFLTFYRPKD